MYRLRFFTRRVKNGLTPMIPEWMQKIEVGPCACCTVSVGKKKGFVQKTISDIFTFFEECLVNDSIAKRKGLLQSLDPRVKLWSTKLLNWKCAKAASSASQGESFRWA